LIGRVGHVSAGAAPLKSSATSTTNERRAAFIFSSRFGIQGNTFRPDEANFGKSASPVTRPAEASARKLFRADALRRREPTRACRRCSCSPLLAKIVRAAPVAGELGAIALNLK